MLRLFKVTSGFRLAIKTKSFQGRIKRAAVYNRALSAEEIQTQVFEVGKRHPFDNLRAWFQALYETLLGSSQGPRMGSFIALYGIENSRKLIAEALDSAGG